MRKADTVSRHGGDEFVILLAEVAQVADAALIAAKLMAAFEVPTPIGDQDLRLTLSVGISIYPDDGEDAATLIDRADVAMYRAKGEGRGNVAFYGEAAVIKPSVGFPSRQSS
jgi:diguanylate cyclase